MADRDEPFLSRWSRLKQESKTSHGPVAGSEAGKETGPRQDRPAAAPEPAPAASKPGQDPKLESPALDVEKIDIGKLGRDSDYRPFMTANVPNELRSKALAKLWLSDPVLGGPEQLSDYMEDFTDAARAVGPGLLKTAYKVGQGFLSDAEAAEWERLGHPATATPGSSSPAAVSVASETPDQPEIAAFLAQSDAYAQSLYPPESNHLVDLSVLLAPNVHFLVARQQGKAVGCVALVSAEDGSAEIKRMWVAPEARGKGVGRKLIEALEEAARQRGIPVLRLETGIRQPEAIALYRKHGFVERPPFGSYQPDPLSLFMEKRLA